MLSVEELFCLTDTSKYQNYRWLIENTDFVEAVLVPTYRELTKMIETSDFDFLRSFYTYILKATELADPNLKEETLDQFLRGYFPDEGVWINTYKLVEAGFIDFLLSALERAVTRTLETI